MASGKQLTPTSDYKLITAVGTTSINNVLKTTIEIAGDKNKADLFVVDDLSGDIIVERDFLNTHGVSINHGKRTIVIRNEIISSYYSSSRERITIKI